jgi:hypothetical protein
MANETGKQRASRIPLDYFRHASPLDRWRLWLAMIALAATLAWIGWAVVNGRAAQLRYSPGPLAEAHALWDDQCEACHIPFQPIKATNLPLAARGTKPADERCRNCHLGAPHHATTRGLAEGCADCHHEHAGRNASLVRLPDVNCVECHANLAEHGAVKTVYRNVEGFDLNHHPDFRLIREKASDPGHLKFNHQMHMSAGMHVAGKADPNCTLAKLSPLDRGHYRLAGQRDTDRVVLECGSCHRLAPGSGNAWSGGTYAGSGYMQPVTYEAHCRACHPLTVEPARGDQPAVEVMHGQNPDVVHRRLTEDYIGRYLADHGSILDAKVERMPLPGRLAPEQAVPVRNVINARVLAAEKTLYQGQQSCALCHELKSTNGAELAEALSVEGPPRLDIVKTNVPAVWFKSAKFNHIAHQSMQCRDCHAGAYADSAAASTQSSDVMIPGIANCMQCHAPRSAQGGGARYDCTQCHRYHGRYALTREPGLARLDLESFILGSAPKKLARVSSP